MSDRDAVDESGVGSLLDDAPCGFVAFADDGIIRAVNTTLADTLGYTPADLVGHHLETLLTVGTRIFYQTHLFPLLRLHGRVEEVFLLLRARDGSDLGALVNAVRRERGGQWVSECILMPVRERRKFEEALLRAKHEAEEARRIAEAKQRALEAANDQLEQQAIELELIQQQLVEQTGVLEVQGEELRTLNETLMEQSHQVELERESAQRANQAKSEFLAVMSHELRTPLNAIGGYVQLVLMGIHGPVTDAQAEALGRIERSQRHLLRLVNDVLNLARIEAGRVDYDIRPVALRDVASAVLPMVEPQLAERGLRHEVDVPRDVVALADREKVQQILLNLLSNAVKFTPSGGSVAVTGRDAGDGSGRACVSVRDTGIGIPADRLPQIFEPFVQVDSSHARRAEGTGLGLAISRDLARGMGGDLTVASSVGEGTTFTLMLPSARTSTR